MSGISLKTPILSPKLNDLDSTSKAVKEYSASVQLIDSWNGAIEFNKDGVFLHEDRRKPPL